MALITGNFTVNGTGFFDYFNSLRRTKTALFPHALSNREYFAKFVNNLEALTGKASIELNEFLAYFLICYNETGGTFKPLAEYGDDAYFFEARNMGTWKKASYNGNYNRFAGSQLLAWGVITQADVNIWNSQTRYPAEQPQAIRLKARQCDFYKFRGRGLNQLTWRPNYEKFVNPLLKKKYGKSIDDFTNEQLDKLFFEPDIYLGVFRNYYFTSDQQKAIEKVKQGDVKDFVTRTAGIRPSYVTEFNNRFNTLKTDLKDKTIINDLKKN